MRMAGKKLSLSMSRSRMHYGEWVYTEPSRFLSEIDKSLFDKSPIDPEDPDVVEMKSAKARSSFFSRYKNF